MSEKAPTFKFGMNKPSTFNASF